MKVRLHIDRLVLEGVSPRDGRAIGASLEQELGRLITEQGLPASWEGPEGGDWPTESLDLPRLDAGSLPVRPNASPRSLGTQLADQILRGSKP